MKKIISFLLIIVFFSPVVIHAEEKNSNWNEETIYFVSIDRFNNGDQENDQDLDLKEKNGYYGGDIKGVTKQLTHIQELGFTAIGISPIFATDFKGYTGRELKDYYKVDAHFGTGKELVNLVKQAHKLKMKIVLDIPNIAVTSTQFSELISYWVEKSNIDGIRLYEVNEQTNEYWREVVQKLKQNHPDLYIIGEYKQGTLKENQKNEPFDNIFFEGYQSSIANSFAKPDQSIGTFLEEAEKASLNDDQPSVVYIDSRETNRFVRYSIEQKYYPEKRLKLALGALLTSPGIPAVYYGTEIGLDGEKGWTNQPVMNFQTKDEMIKHIESLQQLRQKYKVLTHGSYQVLYEKDGFAVVKREYKDETFVIGINNTSKNQMVKLTADQLQPNMELRGLFTDDGVKWKDNAYSVVINRETVNVLALGEERGINKGFLFAIGTVIILFVLFLVVAYRKGKNK